MLNNVLSVMVNYENSAEIYILYVFISSIRAKKMYITSSAFDSFMFCISFPHSEIMTRDVTCNRRFVTASSS